MYQPNPLCVCQCENPIPGDSCAHTVCKNCRGDIFLNHYGVTRLVFGSDTKLLTLDNIRQYCLNYDKYNDCYPESIYEGLSVYNWICQQIDPTLKFNDNDFDLWEGEIKK